MALSVSLPRGGGNRAFGSPNELHAFRDREVEIWRWLENVHVSAHHWRELERQFTGALLAPWDQSQDEGRLAVPDLWVPSESTIGISVLNVAQKQRGVAAAMWRALVEPEGDLHDLQTRDGISALGLLAVVQAEIAVVPQSYLDNAFALQNGLRQELDNARAAREFAIEVGKGQHAKAEQLAAELRARTTEESTRLSRFLSDREVELANAEKERAGEFNGTLLAWRQAHEEALKVYKEELALKAPVTYWETKAKEHRGTATKLWVVFALLLIVPCVIVFEAHALLDLASNPVHVGTVLVVLALAIWPTRIVARMLSSNIHLASDAEERVAASKAYLALVEEKHGLAPEDRKLILEVLFRPAVTGLVKDDGSGPAVFMMLSRLLERGGKTP